MILQKKTKKTLGVQIWMKMKSAIMIGIIFDIVLCGSDALQSVSSKHLFAISQLSKQIS